jgi:phage baseplate assembly protein W
MVKKKFFGIKYPFKNESNDNYFIDLNESYEDKMKSELLHIIFTPKGQRYRMPDFGTDIVKYLFEPNDSETWDGLQREISEQVSKYLPNVTFGDIKILLDEENGNAAYAEIKYRVSKGSYEEENNIQVRIM